MPFSTRLAGLAMFAAAIATIAWAALILQLWLTLGIVIGQGRGVGMGLVVCSGFFTVLTNLLAALVVSAITLVNMVYFLILRHVWKPQGLQFAVDAVLRNAGGMLLAYAAIVGMLCGLKARWFWHRNKLEAP